MAANRDLVTELERPESGYLSQRGDGTRILCLTKKRGKTKDKILEFEGRGLRMGTEMGRGGMTRDN